MLGSKQVRKKKAYRTYGAPPMAVKPLSQSPAVDKGVAYDPVIPMTVDPITDMEGLKRAKAGGNTYVHGNTMYINGTETLGDWVDNVKHIPDWGTINKVKQGVAGALRSAGVNVLEAPDAPSDWGNIKETARYKQALKTLKEHPEITHVSGHSLGGAVALELQREFPQLETRTYGAPVFEPTGIERLQKGSENVHRYRNWNDPVAQFDNSAQLVEQGKNAPNTWSSYFNHNYDDIASQFKSGAPAEMTRNLDGSYNLYA